MKLKRASEGAALNTMASGIGRRGGGCSWREVVSRLGVARSGAGCVAAVGIAAGLAQMAGAQCNYPQIVLGDTPLAYWRMNENPATTSGSGGMCNDIMGFAPGVYRAEVVLGGQGIVSGNSCAQFAGGARVDLQALPNLYARPEHAVEAWVQPGTASGDLFIYSESVDGGPTFLLRVSTGHFEYGLAANTNQSINWNFATGSIPAQVGRWYYVCGQLSGGVMSLYVGDGQTLWLDARISPAFSYRYYANWATIGAARCFPSATPCAPFNGAIDEVAIYAHALSTERMQARMGALSPRIVSQPVSVRGCGEDQAQFSIGLVAPGTFTYSWRHNGMAVNTMANPSAASAMLVLTGIEPMDAGMYDCVVTGACGSATSDVATLTVCGCGECPADFNRDGGIDGADVGAFFAAWASGGCEGDVNDDGGVDGADVSAFFEAWEAGGC